MIILPRTYELCRYGTEENYEFMELNGTVAYVKYNRFHIEHCHSMYRIHSARKTSITTRTNTNSYGLAARQLKAQKYKRYRDFTKKCLYRFFSSTTAKDRASQTQ